MTMFSKLTLMAALGLALTACAQPAGYILEFDGVLSDKRVFSGYTIIDGRTRQNRFCARASDGTRCTATFPPSTDRNHKPIKFTCTNGLTGQAESEEFKNYGKWRFATRAWVTMSDGTVGGIDISDPKPWFGAELCSK